MNSTYAIYKIHSRSKHRHREWKRKITGIQQMLLWPSHHQHRVPLSVRQKVLHVPEKYYALLYNSTAMDRKCVHYSVYSIGITNLLPFHVDQVDAICMSMNFDQYQRKLSWNDKNDNESSHLSLVNWANIAKMISKQADWLESCHIPKHTDMYVYCVCLWKSRCVYLMCASFSSFDPCYGAYVHFYLTSNGIDSVSVSQWIVCWTEIVKDIDFILPVRGVWINH